VDKLNGIYSLLQSCTHTVGHLDDLLLFNYKMLAEYADKGESRHVGGQSCVSDEQVTQVHQLQHILLALKYLLANRMCQPDRVFKVISHKSILLPIQKITPRQDLDFPVADHQQFQ
jgi:hypothetical protein